MEGLWLPPVWLDRIGGGVTYQWGENNQNSITVNVEMLHQP